jgi:hypothetical protein
MLCLCTEGAFRNQQKLSILLFVDVIHEAESYGFFLQKLSISPPGRFYFAGFTSTLTGKSESLLPHFGHFPLCRCKISSGGFNSAPSYNTLPHR